MADLVKKMTKIVGIAEKLPEDSYVFKQFNIDEILRLPKEMQDIISIDSVSIDINIHETKIIKTPHSKSFENQRLTGMCMVVEGTSKQNIKYTADRSTQIVNSVSFILPFRTFVVLPYNFVIGDRYEVQGYIEDINIAIIDKRTMYENISIFIDVII